MFNFFAKTRERLKHKHLEALGKILPQIMNNSSCEIPPPTFRGKNMPNIKLSGQPKTQQGKGLLELAHPKGFTLSDPFAGLERI